MVKRIIIEMDVDYWTPEARKGLMHFLIHHFKVIEECEACTEDTEEGCHICKGAGEISNFRGVIIEPKKPYPLIPINKQEDKEFEIEW